MNRGRILLALATLLSTSAHAEIWVLCDVASGDVVLEESAKESRHAVMDGPFPGERTAKIWVEENCPDLRCDRDGACAKPEVPGGWEAGELTSVTLSAPPSAAETTPRTEPGGPPAANLSPLINNTKAAANGCNYSAALASVDHMANFDPKNPFYVANRDKLKGLSRRQRQTEQTVWRASSALSSGNLKGARDLAQAAADTAVSCQNQAVAVLLDGIDTAIKQKREARHLANRQAAAALLPGLVDLSRALSGEQSGPAPDPDALAASTAAVFGLELSTNAADTCTFKYEYRNKWDTEPLCTCDGYTFAARRFRCEHD